jgi:hypothetical protein
MHNKPKIITCYYFDGAEGTINGDGGAGSNDLECDPQIAHKLFLRSINDALIGLSLNTCIVLKIIYSPKMGGIEGTINGIGSLRGLVTC